jgi:hypothetical protein
VSAIRASFRIDVQLSIGVWTSLGRDVCQSPAVQAVRGCRQNGPLDHVAAIGTLDFELRNDSGNSGATQGWYSPNHASCRSGWGYGIACRLVSTYQSATLGDVTPQDRTLWTGKITAIRPTPGTKLERRVHVTAQDCLGDLATNDVVQIAPQINQAEDALITAVLASMPSTAQPPATSLDAGLDLFPYAFDTLGAGVKALSAIADVIVSSYGWLYAKADGTLRYENRHTRAVRASVFSFTDATHNALEVPSDLANVYNRVRVTIHPRTIDAFATTVLTSTTGTLSLPPGETIEVFDSYRAPTNTQQLIGGTAFVALVAGTDYVANSQADGLGTDLTADVTVTPTTFASAVKFSIVNNGTSFAYLTTRQLRGKGIYDNGPVTFESYIAKSYGDRPLEIDLLYQSDPDIAQAFADYIANLYSLPMNQVDVLGFDPQRSDALMTQALTREIGDQLTETETMTGIAAARLSIVGIEMTIADTNLSVRYLVAAADSAFVFILDDAVHGVLGSALAPLAYA